MTKCASDFSQPASQGWWEEGGGSERAVLMEAQPEAAGGDLGGVGGGRPMVWAMLDRTPAALLGFLGFHSSIILMFFPLKAVSH